MIDRLLQCFTLYNNLKGGLFDLALVVSLSVSVLLQSSFESTLFLDVYRCTAQ